MSDALAGAGMCATARPARLEGSIRKAGDRVRITAQLCEAEAGAHVWSGRFDGELADIFDLQDRLTEAVVGAIEPSLRLAEVARIRAKSTESLTAYDLYLRARARRHRTDCDRCGDRGAK